MIKLFDRVKVNIPTTGTGDIEFGAAASTAFLTPAEAGVLDGDEVRYVIVDGLDFEEGVGLIKDTVATMERTVTKSKIGGVVGTSALNLSGTAVLALSASAADILTPDDNLASLVDADTALDNLGGTAVGKAVFTATGQAAARGSVGAVGAIRVQKFTSSGTYTPDANLIYAVIECVGGGGGGGAGVGATGSVFAGAGGGSGGYSRKYMDATTIGASQTVTIGAGGAGGAGDADGGAGGATSFGSACTANGGGGGKRSSTSVFPLQGAGASVGTGDFTAAGTAGGGGVYSDGATNPRFPSGEGAGSIFGGGAIGVNSSNTAGTANGVNASGYGGGGSGGGAFNAAVNQNGGSGSAGVVIVTEYCSE